MLTVRPRNYEETQRALDRWFTDTVSRFLEQPDGTLRSGTWSPPVDIEETRDALLFHVELPGFEREMIDINVENNRLTLSGERKFEEQPEGREYHRVERFYGKFFRTFQLPNTADVEGISANLKNGVLTVSVPKRADAKPRQIEVKV